MSHNLKPRLQRRTSCFIVSARKYSRSNLLSFDWLYLQLKKISLDLDRRDLLREPICLILDRPYICSSTCYDHCHDNDSHAS